MDYRERQGIDRIIGSTKLGSVTGMSVPGVHDDTSFVNIFLGIPYAKPPIGIDMFKVGHYYYYCYYYSFDYCYYNNIIPV